MDVASPRYVGPKATVQLILEELEDLPNWSANSTQQPFFASPACEVFCGRSVAQLGGSQSHC